MIFQYQMKICPNFHVSLPPSVIKEKVFFFLVGQVVWKHPCGDEKSSYPAALLVLHVAGLVGFGHNKGQNDGALLVEYTFVQYQHQPPTGSQEAPWLPMSPGKRKIEFNCVQKWLKGRVSLGKPLEKRNRFKIAGLKSQLSCTDMADAFSESHSAAHKCGSHFS